MKLFKLYILFPYIEVISPAIMLYFYWFEKK